MSRLGDEEMRAFQEEASYEEERAARAELSALVHSVWEASGADGARARADVLAATGVRVDPGVVDPLQDLTVAQLRALARSLG